MYTSTQYTNAYKYTPTSQANKSFCINSVNIIAYQISAILGQAYIFSCMIYWVSQFMPPASRLVATLMICPIEIMFILLIYLRLLMDLHLVLSTFSDVLKFIRRPFMTRHTTLSPASLLTIQRYKLLTFHLRNVGD